MGTIWILLSLSVLIVLVIAFERFVMRTPKGSLKDLGIDPVSILLKVLSSLLLRR